MDEDNWQIETIVARWGWEWYLGTTKGQITSLLSTAVLLILGGALCWMTTDGTAEYKNDFEQSIWFSWGIFFDPGTQTGLASDAHIKVQAVAIFFSIVGFVFNLVMLGLIVDSVRAFMQWHEIMHDRIVHNQHILILGWSDKIAFFLRELDHIYQADGVNVVILADEDEVFMKKELVLLQTLGVVGTYTSYLWARYGWGQRDLQVEVRRGNIQRMDDLRAVSVLSARSIVVLGTDGKPIDSDQVVIRSVMAAEGVVSEEQHARADEEIKITDNMEVVQRITGHASRRPIAAREMITRLLATATVQPSRAGALLQMLSMDFGNVLQTGKLPHLAGQRLCDILSDKIVILGRIAVQYDRDGVYAGVNWKWIHPNETFDADDEIIYIYRREVVANASAKSILWGEDYAVDDEDDVTKGPIIENYQVPDLTLYQYKMMRNFDLKQAQCVVILGWAADILDLLESFEELLVDGSEIHILSDVAAAKRDAFLDLYGLEVNEETGECKAEAGQPMPFSRFKLFVYEGQPTLQRDLRHLPLRRADTFLVIADDLEDDEPAESSDSRCVTALLVLQSIIDEVHRDSTILKPRPFVCEILGFQTMRMIESMRGLKHLNKEAMHFYSNELECGLFAGCTKRPFVTDLFFMLLDPGNLDGVEESAMESEYRSQYKHFDHHHPRLATYKVEAFLDPHTMRKGVTFFMLKRLAMERGCQLIGWYRPRSERVRNLNHSQDFDDSKVSINYHSAIEINPPNKCGQEVTFVEGDELLMLDQGIPEQVKIGVKLPEQMQWMSRNHSTLVAAPAPNAAPARSVSTVGLQAIQEMPSIKEGSV